MLIILIVSAGCESLCVVATYVLASGFVVLRDGSVRRYVDSIVPCSIHIFSHLILA